MGFNYGYKLNDNPKLTSLGEISFEPVTEEHRARVDREIAIFRTIHRIVKPYSRRIAVYFVKY